jgi:hypothetical protein
MPARHCVKELRQALRHKRLRDKYPRRYFHRMAIYLALLLLTGSSSFLGESSDLTRPAN